MPGFQGKSKAGMTELSTILIPLPSERTPLATDPATRQAVQTLLDGFPNVTPNRPDIADRLAASRGTHDLIAGSEGAFSTNLGPGRDRPAGLDHGEAPQLLQRDARDDADVLFVVDEQEGRATGGHPARIYEDSAMYGLVNQAIEDLVRSRHGDTVWDAVKARAGLDVHVFVGMDPYPDDVTDGLVRAAAEVLEQPAAALLEAFGEHWTLFTAERGYGHMLQAGGASF